MSLVFNPDSSFGIECPQCSNQLIAPESSEYWSESNIHHVWRCPKCDFGFETIGNNKSVVMTGKYSPLTLSS
jgi:hypothetical protein